MTRTTELLATIKNCNINKYENCSDCEMCKSELKGRLDALKEEVIFLNKVKRWVDIPVIYFCYIHKELASIQEEIKLIEGAI